MSETIVQTLKRVNHVVCTLYLRKAGFFKKITHLFLYCFKKIKCKEEHNSKSNRSLLPRITSVVSGGGHADTCLCRCAEEVELGHVRRCPLRPSPKSRPVTWTRQSPGPCPPSPCLPAGCSLWATAWEMPGTVPDTHMLNR